MIKRKELTDYKNQLALFFYNNSNNVATEGFQTAKSLYLRAFFTGVKSFPLYCSGGFTCYIIDYSVDMFNFVDDAVGDSA